MKLLPLPLTLADLTLHGRPAVATQALTQGLDEAALPHTSRGAAEPDWRSAYQRRRAQEDEPRAEPGPDASTAVPPLAAWAPREAAPESPAVRTAAPATATAERVDALRQLAESPPAAPPMARVWQVELPATAGPGWQLHVGQAQPQAPLSLDLRVPPAAQAQARQQLSDLDKRLRDAGHDVLRPRVREASRSSKRSRPVDEVES